MNALINKLLYIVIAAWRNRDFREQFCINVYTTWNLCMTTACRIVCCRCFTETKSIFFDGNFDEFRSKYHAHVDKLFRKTSQRELVQRHAPVMQRSLCVCVCVCVCDYLDTIERSATAAVRWLTPIRLISSLSVDWQLLTPSQPQARRAGWGEEVCRLVHHNSCHQHRPHAHPMHVAMYALYNMHASSLALSSFAPNGVNLHVSL